MDASAQRVSMQAIRSGLKLPTASWEMDVRSGDGRHSFQQLRDRAASLFLFISSPDSSDRERVILEPA
jgi:hypothetical protein